MTRVQPPLTEAITYLCNMQQEMCVCVCVRCTSVSQTEGPESEVRGSVGDSTQTILDGVDSLMDEDLTELKLLSLFLITITILFAIHLYTVHIKCIRTASALLITQKLKLVEIQ